MGLLTRALAIPERRSADIVETMSSPWKNWLGQIVDTVAGRPVSAASALSIVAVHAANRVLAEGVSALPLHVYRRLQPQGREKDTGFYLYRLLHDQPNPEQTAVEFIETLQGHLPLWGNAYAEIVRDAGNRPTALWPLRPDRIALYRPTRQSELQYLYNYDDGTRVALRKDQVFHLHGLGFDGNFGYSLLSLHRRTFGLTVAAEEFGTRFYENDATPGVVIMTPPGFTATSIKNLADSWAENHRGPANVRRTAVLENGVDIKDIGIPQKDAQYLELLGFQKAEVSTMFRIPPHMIGDVERSTSWGTGIEQQTIGFVTFSLTPWLRRWEQAIWRDLITTPYQSTHFAKFSLDALLRGDTLSRYQAYHLARMDGWMNADTIRELEDLNPIPDGGGTGYFMPLNMTPVDQIGKPDQQAAARMLMAAGIDFPDPLRDLKNLTNGHEPEPVLTGDRE